jgi:RNA polymerase sigma-70 factor (ECF subfamily)
MGTMVERGHADANATDENEVIARGRVGDPAATRALYVRYFPNVYRSARHLGIPISEIDDVTQEVFEKAFKRLDRFEGGSFAGWLQRICANVVTDHHRRRRVRETFRRLWKGDAADAPGSAYSDVGQRDASPEGAAAQAEAENHVSSILARMRPKLREVFALFELERLSGEEIAARLECPAPTVRTRLFHARREFLRIGRAHGWIEPEGAKR